MDRVKRYRVAGTCREIYLHTPKPTASGVSQTDPSTVTEIQFPVEKYANCTPLIG